MLDTISEGDLISILYSRMKCFTVTRSYCGSSSLKMIRRYFDNLVKDNHHPSMLFLRLYRKLLKQ